MKQQFAYVVNSEKEILAFLKSQYPLYHMSNIFFRDIQYGIQTMFERKDVKIGYADAEKIAKAFVAQLERKKILVKIDGQSWVLHYPDFRKPPAKTAPAAKPSGPAAAVPGPATGTPSGVKPSLPPLKSGTPAASPGTLPQLKSATPAAARPGGSPPSLPPLKSATPAGTPPSLPPLKSSAPAAAKPGGSPPTLPPLKSTPAAPKQTAAVSQSPESPETNAPQEQS